MYTNFASYHHWQIVSMLFANNKQDSTCKASPYAKVTSCPRIANLGCHVEGDISIKYLLVHQVLELDSALICLPKFMDD